MSVGRWRWNTGGWLPAGPGAAVREHERRRLYYVAATRARDLLVLPLPDTKGRQLPYATREVARDADASAVERFEMFRPHRRPAWAAPIAPPRR